MELIRGNDYYVKYKSVVLRAEPDGRSEPKNHLIYGDWTRFRGNTDGDWAQIFSRGNTGWVPKKSLQEERVLEINFVDIGIGDGCHIVTPDDQIILIDAGKTDNMSRFLNWRYNLRSRNVVGVEGVEDGDNNVKPPMEIDYVVLSHPDQDHYYGFKPLFENKKLSYKKVYHNGIVEVPKDTANEEPDLDYPWDLGGFITKKGVEYLWDTIESDSEMKSIIRRFPRTTKKYLSTLRPLLENNPNVEFKGLNHTHEFLDDFDLSNDISIQILGPVTDKIERNGVLKNCLKMIGDEGETKNGHSVVLKLKYNLLNVFLGGDLNTESEDHLLHFYAKTELEVSKLEKEITKLNKLGNTITNDEKQELSELKSDLNAIIAKARRFFQVDIAKACHHGSHHFSETFLKCLNTIVTVVSSGDGDSYAHPRPDALGAFGKYGRGERPLIFSTEIGRSTNEFTYIKEYFDEILDFQKRIAEASPSDKSKIEQELEERRDSNVATYGMITLRTNGKKVYIAQKLEAPRSKASKWDIHELEFNPKRNEFEYIEKT